ncbi:uncharacterized protein N7483_008686 [Penicillium malachiteum]|uniref:uncharacterized protein n=1 Tax=Penicillium malachiteum TaxID=1324776 RepID=UPI002549020B|nr:uncharacterized protein N7483_008686 [Penicillium malachiteum]KAJ5720752.1 hypothetical protein N7483_008686 [Penicillium malachiteum]
MSAPHNLDFAHINLYLAITKGCQCAPAHWIILMQHPGSPECTWLHSVINEDNQYEVMIEPAKRFDSWSFASKDFLVRLPICQKSTILAMAKAVPAQSCQCWASYMLLRFQNYGYLDQGTYEVWRDLHMTSRRLDRGPGCMVCQC